MLGRHTSQNTCTGSNSPNATRTKYNKKIFTKTPDRLQCPLAPSSSPPASIISWLLGAAVRLEYGEKTERFNKEVKEVENLDGKTGDFSGPEFEAGVAALAELLKVLLYFCLHYYHLQPGAMASWPLCEATGCFQTCSIEIVQRGAGQPRYHYSQGSCLSIPWFKTCCWRDWDCWRDWGYCCSQTSPYSGPTSATNSDQWGYCGCAEGSSLFVNYNYKYQLIVFLGHCQPKDRHSVGEGWTLRRTSDPTRIINRMLCLEFAETLILWYLMWEFFFYFGQSHLLPLVPVPLWWSWLQPLLLSELVRDGSSNSQGVGELAEHHWGGLRKCVLIINVSMVNGDISPSLMVLLEICMFSKFWNKILEICVALLCWIRRL